MEDISYIAKETTKIDISLTREQLQQLATNAERFKEHYDKTGEYLDV